MTISVECCTNWADLDEAKRMIKVAKESGAELVKFQLYNAEDDRGKPHYDWVKARELTFDQAKMLFDYGASIGQEIFFSVFAPIYVDWCEKIGVKEYKVARGIGEKELIKSLAETGKPIIISTDGISFPNLNQKASWVGHPPEYELKISEMGYMRTKWLYCPYGYPWQPKALSKVIFGYYGFSDHTIGLDAAKIALARGARIVEKHFALEHNPAYPDDAWSMTPEELRELVKWEKICQEVL